MSPAGEGLLPPSTFIGQFSAAFGGVLLVLCIAIIWTQWKMTMRYRNFPRKRLDVRWAIPVLLGRYPKAGTYTSFVFQLLLKTAKEFREEGLCVVWLLQPFILIFNEKHMKYLVNNIDITDKGFAFDANKQIFGNGILSSHHDLWKVRRKLLSLAFSVEVLKSKMLILNNYARQLADKLEALVDKPGDDAWDLIKYCMCQNMADFVLGVKLDDPKNEFPLETSMNHVETLGEQFMERIFNPWLSWDFMLPFFRKGRQYLKNIRQLNSDVKKNIEDLKKKTVESDGMLPGEESQTFSCVVDILMKLYLVDHVLTEKDVRDEIVTISAAAYETVSRTMLSCFYTLGHHPQVQEKAYREIQSIVPDGDVTYEDLAKLKYLDCVIKETLRLYSTVPLYERKARNDIQCGQYTIPKGSYVNVFSFVMHRDPNVFPDPEKFDPERFIDTSNLRPWMYIPFFEGYRYCIGKKFAMMEMKVNLVHVLRRVRIRSLNKISDNDLDWGITLKLTKALRFSFQSRVSQLS